MTDLLNRAERCGKKEKKKNLKQSRLAWLISSLSSEAEMFGNLVALFCAFCSIQLINLLFTSISAVAAQDGSKKAVTVASSSVSTSPAAPTGRPSYTPFRSDTIVGLKTGDGKECLIAEFGGRLNFRQFGQQEFDSRKPFRVEIPGNATISGSCARNRESDASLSFKWSTPNGTFILFMLFSSKEKMQTISHIKAWGWQMDTIWLKFDSARDKKTGEPLLPNFDAMGNVTTSSPIWAPMPQSFYCKHSVTVPLIPSRNDTPVDMDVQFKSNMKVQAYEIHGGFGNTYLCDRTRVIGIMERLQTQSTIATGSLLGIASIGVILGHGVKRHFFAKRQDYSTME